jgi:large subunit ribosomal protein L6
VKVDAALAQHVRDAMAGTTRALIANMVTGVTTGFQKKLELVGVGYRAAVQGKKLNLTLGFSHPVEYPIPTGITIETPSQHEIIVKGMDRQQVGQVPPCCALTARRSPTRAKGPYIRNERIVLKEAKKK